MGIKEYAKTTINVTLDDDDFSKVICGLLEIGEKKLLVNLLIKRACHELSYKERGDK